ncbi:hypothetical protein ATI61_109195 [Archangium gephyra]|uniref:Uncharacterized protein n=1 Tax=Archangium gephyra TaxID=48 RepID=A0AAC8Q251_9BACT|nr:hypothetical protein [Archangium gephyra]AKI99614.1 Hypothetical protein AA314_01241 [Archangium gephyra]REG27854.1 hypothetical protein ATI61_109195 [Archangium gephyra]
MSSKKPVGGSLAIEIEMRAEAAASIRVLGQRIERQLTELQQLGQQVRAMAPSPARDRKLAEYDEKRREAEYRKWTLIVQREAMGLFNHDDVEEIYRVPPRLS